MKQKTFRQWLYALRSSHTRAMDPSVKLGEMGNGRASSVEDG